MIDDVRCPSDSDWRWLRRAEEHILELLRQHYGEVLLDHTEADLHLAQRLVAEEVVSRDQDLELQCLGVVLGNVLATRTSMQWAVVTNEYGTMLALHSTAIRFTLYPLTMISKRLQQRREVDIPGLYRSFVDDLGLSAG